MSQPNGLTPEQKWLVDASNRLHRLRVDRIRGVRLPAGAVQRAEELVRRAKEQLARSRNEH
jgi:hypothetical protein